MVKTIFITLILAIGTICIPSLTAQQTGSFEIEVNFNEVDYDFDRILYYYVPSDYDETQTYPLVVGLRGGPHSNAGQFRDQLTFLSDSLGAIIVCPENIAHFNSDEGLMKQLYQYSVSLTMDMYSIDPDLIYLTGLSFGGRHAVIIAMDTDHGEIPKLRGVIPFATGSNAHLQPDYESIDQFAPACICIGLNDSQTFISVANNLNNAIESNGGDVFLNEIPNVGHTVVFASYKDEMMECIDYIEAQYAVSSTSEIQSNQSTVIYPNPTRQTLTLDVGQITPLSIYLTDMDGRVVSHYPTDTRSISVSNMPKGIYVLTIESEAGVETHQVLVD